jgi:hypothetical protein
LLEDLFLVLDREEILVAIWRGRERVLTAAVARLKEFFLLLDREEIPVSCGVRRMDSP